MEFDKLSEYADEQALKKQTDFILNLFDMVEKKGLEMAEGLKSSFSLFSSANTGTKQMADEIKNSSLTAANYQKVLAALADEVDHLTDAQKEQLKAINENFKAQEQARAGAKETVNLIKTEIAQNEKLEAGRSQLAKTIAQNRVQLQQQNKELMQAARLKESEIGSNKRLDATIAFLTTRLNKLNQATDDGKKKAELYQKSIGLLWLLRWLWVWRVEIHLKPTLAIETVPIATTAA
jgi:DNA repair exonuclease SbcCD ATPase subunit